MAHLIVYVWSEVLSHSRAKIITVSVLVSAAEVFKPETEQPGEYKLRGDK